MMERKIVDYVVVCGEPYETGHRFAITRLVMEKISEGYVLYGNPFCDENWVYQGMVKYG